MDLEEKLQILQSAKLLEAYENTPRPFNDPYVEMTSTEKSKLIIYLQELLEEQKRQVKAQQLQAETQRELAEKERANADQLMAKLDNMANQCTELLQLIKEQEKENARLKMEIAKVLKASAALVKRSKN